MCGPKSLGLQRHSTAVMILRLHVCSIKRSPVASAPVALQMRRDEEGMRTKLRQMLPAESMEIALTRPDLLQRWEQRQAKKKALEVASARRRAASATRKQTNKCLIHCDPPTRYGWFFKHQMKK